MPNENENADSADNETNKNKPNDNEFARILTELAHGNKIASIYIDQRSGGTFFSGETQIHGDVIGRDQSPKSFTPKNIFLAYASVDYVMVEELYKKLKQRGHTPWMDKKNLLPGQNWKITIEQTIGKSDYFILCWSKNAAQKEGFIQKEIRLALETLEQKPEGRIFLIPIKLEPCNIPSSLNFVHWAEFEDKDFYSKLFSAIETELKNN